MSYTFVPIYTIESASTEDEAFEKFIDAIERDVAHYRQHGSTQIEYRTLEEMDAEAREVAS